ncbi:CFEM domain-containing protein, partial [Metarhizium majus ARSEF 297]
MKSTLLLLACAFTGSVVAQNRKDYFPECSLKCLDQATKQATDCSMDDAVCMCVQKNYEAIYNAGVNCVLQACGPDEAVGKVLPAGAKFCAAATAQAKAGGASKTTAPTATGPATGVVIGNTTSAASTRSSAGQATSTSAPGAAATDAPGRALGLLVAGLLAAL